MLSRTRFSDELKDNNNVMVSISALGEQLSLMRDYRHSLINETVTKGLDKTVSFRDSRIPWIGEIPSHWKVRRIRHIIQPNVFGIRVGPFGSSLTEAVVSEEYGSLISTSTNVTLIPGCLCSKPEYLPPLL